MPLAEGWDGLFLGIASPELAWVYYACLECRQGGGWTTTQPPLPSWTEAVPTPEAPGLPRGQVGGTRGQRLDACSGDFVVRSLEPRVG